MGVLAHQAEPSGQSIARLADRRAVPGTRSGKIMRRILRKIAEGEVSAIGDVSTLADPAVVDDLVANRLTLGK